MADPAGDPVVGVTLAGFRIERRLGRGGMSVVYLAEDLALGRRVALKVLAPELSGDQAFRERFRLESRLAASIDHPNVIPVYEAGEAEGQLYIAMRYVEGTDFRRLIDEESALETARAVELVARAADGLQAAHERGLVHRDVKPSNLLIASPGEHEHVYLADFGLTKTTESEEEAREAAQLSGTPTTSPRS
jgi:serine/threonine protein kinase